MFARTKTMFAPAVLVLCLCGLVRADELITVKPETILVTVGGEVMNKGRYTLPKGSTFMDAINAAGGLTIYAPTKIRLVHGSQVSIIDSRKLRNGNSQGPILESGDQIQVPQEYF